MENSKITLTLPDSSKREYDRGVTGTTVAGSIGRRLAEEAVAIRVDGSVVDLSSPIEHDADIAILTFQDDEGREVYWHSTSHLMAHAIESLYPGAKFGVGPAIENGFYYDVDIEHVFTPEDLLAIEKRMLEISKEDKPFVRCELSKSRALAMFTEKGDQYKQEIISGLDDHTETISIYEEGAFTDLCRGPHVPSAGSIKHVKLLSVSGSYWKGDAKNKQLQRIYGVSFPKKKDLEEHLERLEEARKRDHRKLGRDLELFSFHEIAPGAPFWHPRGMIIFKELERLVRELLDSAGYDEILTPIMVKKDLWEESGHWDYYQEHMFLLDVEEEKFSLKPMNCPESTYIYRAKVRSYRDLPLRYSEFGRNHRNELSGVLNGMFRVRQFHMDDAHLFVRPDQIQEEITNLLGLVKRLYAIFHFEPSFCLSTKPEKALGSDELWNEAEKALEHSLKANNINFKLNPGDGAFYGPKIDISIKDALQRSWQLATIQLDFQMPERFKLEYIDEHNERKRPVMIHRAIMGSFERFVGVLIEHFGGAFPLWLSPVQAVVIPISDTYLDYGKAVEKELKDAGIRVELDSRNEKVGYKIRDWEVHKVPYMLVVGEKEQQQHRISVRKHKEGDLGALDIDSFVKDIRNKIDNRL
jgi:threonyl-tRNA synthetase